MKWGLLLLSMLLTRSSALSQVSSPDTLNASNGRFLNIAWGESQESARQKMLERSEVKFDKEVKLGQSGSTLVFGGGTLFGVDVRSFELSFVGNQFYSVRVTMAAAAGQRAVFDRLKGALIAAYGRPVNEVPASSDTLTAAAEGLLSAFWSFPAGGDIGNSIFLKSEGGDRLIVEFHDGRLLNEAWQRGEYR